MTDVETFWENVRLAWPDNPAPLLVFADWLDEKGESATAYALRWAAGHQKRPFFRTDVQRQPWVWYLDSKFTARHAGISEKRLRDRRYAAIVRPIHWGADGQSEIAYVAGFPKIHAAYMWLGRGLAELRKVVEVPTIVLPPAPVIVRPEPESVTCAACGITRARKLEVCPVCHSRTVKS